MLCDEDHVELNLYSARMMKHCPVPSTFPGLGSNKILRMMHSYVSRTFKKLTFSPIVYSQCPHLPIDDHVGCGSSLKTPGARVPGRISHPPFDSPPPLWLSVSPWQNHGQLTVIIPNLSLLRGGTYYPRPGWETRLKEKHVFAGFQSNRQTQWRKEPLAPAGFA